MQTKATVFVHAVKESSGTFEGKAFSSTQFHCEVALKENGVGRAIGRVTRPFKLGDHREFDKWLPLQDRLNEGPIEAEATFELEATKDGSKMNLVAIEALPVRKPPQALQQPIKV